MTRIEESIEVRAPIERVFAAITDPRRAPEWNPGIVEVRDVSDRPVRQGTTWRQTMMVMGRLMTFTCFVEQYQPPRHGVLSIEGDQGGQVVSRCEPVPNGTRVIQTFDFTLPGGKLGGLAGGLVANKLKGELTASLKRMRDTVEHETNA